MAQRRMFSKSITNSSQFLMMPLSSQALYFHLGMNADDDGFCEHFGIMRMTESKPDDLRILQAKGFIHVFDNKVLIIRDWKENNYIRADRYTQSKYLKQYKKEIRAISKGSIGIPDANQEESQDRLGNVSEGKNIITAEQVGGNNNIEKLADYFIEIKGNNERRNRYLRSASELLTLCDDSFEKAKEMIDKAKRWANEEGLEWELETVCKRYLELNK